MGTSSLLPTDVVLPHLFSYFSPSPRREFTMQPPPSLPSNFLDQLQARKGPWISVAHCGTFWRSTLTSITYHDSKGHLFQRWPFFYTFNSVSLLSTILHVLEQVQAKITDDSDVAWTRYATPAALRVELDLGQLNVHFAPTSTLQEHAISNGRWEEYLQLSAAFDKAYASFPAS